MKITAISDTHGLHNKINLLGGDLLIHAGDICNHGTQQEAANFIEWFEKQPYTFKVFIAGNHDFFFENFTQQEIQNILPENIFYLNDSGAEIEGIKIWGSPITPDYNNWAFNRKRGVEIEIHWQLIPKDIDILITHGPPYRILDTTRNDLNAGCEDLLQKASSIAPAFHIFGHIHEAFGWVKKDNTTFINAASVNIDHQIRKVPFTDFEM